MTARRAAEPRSGQLDTGRDDAQRSLLLGWGLRGLSGIALVLAAAAALEANAGLAAAFGALGLLSARARACADGAPPERVARSLLALLAIGALLQVLLEGTFSSRLGVLHLAVIVLGLGLRRPAGVVACSGALGVLVLGATAAREWAGAPIPLSPSHRPPWLDVLLQVAVATALIVAYTRCFRRELEIFAQHTDELETARRALAAVRAVLASRVQSRSTDLERATRDLARFITSMSHDLKAPLRQMHGFIEIQMDQLADASPYRQALLELLSATDTLSDRVERVLERERHPRGVRCGAQQSSECAPDSEG